MWHYVQNGQAHGPVDISTLQRLIQDGLLKPADLVWKYGMAAWSPLGTIPELFFAAASSQAPPPIPPLYTPPPLSAAAMDPALFDIEHHKVFAALAYFSLLFLVPLLAAPKSPFARYHANQGLVLFLALSASSLALCVLGLMPLGWLILMPLGILLPFAGLTLIVIGVIHAAQGQFKPLPLIGHFQILS